MHLWCFKQTISDRPGHPDELSRTAAAVTMSAVCCLYTTKLCSITTRVTKSETAADQCLTWATEHTPPTSIDRSASTSTSQSSSPSKWWWSAVTRMYCWICSTAAAVAVAAVAAMRYAVGQLQVACITPTTCLLFMCPQCQTVVFTGKSAAAHSPEKPTSSQSNRSIPCNRHGTIAERK